MLLPAGNPISPNSWVENTKNSPMGLSENSEPSNPVVYHHFPIFSHIFPYFPNKITIFTGAKKKLSPGLAGVSGILQV
jgi:hypothetical protein